MIIGICGKSGSGKSTVANQIVNNYKNIVHLDIDKIAHKSHQDENIKEKIIELYGERVLKDNQIDRKKLSKIVFSSNIEMKKLKEITWNFMEKEIDEFMFQNKDKIIILDYILLPLTKYLNMCDIKILLDIPYEIRRDRVIKRDNITEELFLLRESSSIEYNKKEFNIVINNSNEEIFRRLKI